MAPIYAVVRPVCSILMIVLQLHKHKILCIKGIVFFCFWQVVSIEILAAAEIIRSEHFWLDVEHIQEVLQIVLVCVEMVFFYVIQAGGHDSVIFKGLNHYTRFAVHIILHIGTGFWVLSVPIDAVHSKEPGKISAVFCFVFFMYRT